MSILLNFLTNQVWPFMMLGPWHFIGGLFLIAVFINIPVKLIKWGIAKPIKYYLNYLISKEKLKEIKK